MGLADDIKAVWDEHDKKLSDAIEAKNQAEYALAAAENKNAVLAEQNTALTANVSTLTAEKAALAGQIAGLETTKATLTARIAELEKIIADLQQPADPGVLPEWGAPVWRDEFDGDLSKWNIRNNALTFDTARNMRANSTIEDGVLHIRGKWLDTPERGSNLPQGIVTHTTGYLDTIGTFSQPYGRWEIRCKVPTGDNTRGALAAFWLRNENKTGEIDIMESWGRGGAMSSTYTKYVQETGVTTFHSNTNGSGSSTNGKPYTKTLWRHFEHGIPRNVSEGFHTYAFEYMPDYIAMYVDSEQVFRVTPTSVDPQVKTRTLAWLWDEDFFGGPKNIRLNLHVGPSKDYWGLPDENNRGLTQDPLDYQIDYVRVYAPQS